MATIKFNDVSLPSWVKVAGVSTSLLPDLSRNTVKVNGRIGTVDFGNEIGERTFEVQYTIVSSSHSDLKAKVRQLAEYLYTDDYERLVFDDEPNKFYLAKVTDSTGYSTIHKYGQGTFTFVCSYPYAFDMTEKTVTIEPSPDPIQITNNGTVEAYPQMKFTFGSNAETFVVANSDQVLQFGTPLDPDKGQTPYNPEPQVFYDSLESLSGWSNATSVPRGVVQGTFSTNGFSFSQANNDYGTGTNWHGAVMKKALPETLQDFKMTAQVGIGTTRPEQRGKVEIFMLDASNNVVGSISMKDAWANGRWNQAEAFAGTNNFCAEFAQKKDAWADFGGGVFELRRIGNVWRAYFAQVDSKTGVHHTRLAKTWTDLGNTTMQKVAQIQLHLAQQGTFPVSTLWIGSVRVNKYVTPAINQKPLAFAAGDELYIDNETGLITKNGEPYLSNLDPSSNFLKLKKGENGVVIYPHSTLSSGEVKFRQRWF